jgi:hypothetical protein
MKRLSPRIIWLLLSDAAIIYGGIVAGMYIRLGFSGSEYQLNERNGWLKIAFASIV